MGVSFIALISPCVKSQPYLKKDKAKQRASFYCTRDNRDTGRFIDKDAVDSEFLLVTKENINNDTIINFKSFTFTNGTYHLSNSFTGEPNTTFKIIISAKWLE